MKLMEISIRRSEAHAAQDLLARGGLTFTPVPCAHGQAVYLVQVPEDHVQSTLRLLQSRIRSLCLQSVTSVDLVQPDPTPVSAFRALSEPDPEGEPLARHLFGFKRIRDH